MDMRRLYYETKNFNKEVIVVNTIFGWNYQSKINPTTWDWEILEKNLPTIELESSMPNFIDIDNGEIEFYSYEDVELNKLIGKFDNNEDNICKYVVQYINQMIHIFDLVSMEDEYAQWELMSVLAKQTLLGTSFQEVVNVTMLIGDDDCNICKHIPTSECVYKAFLKNLTLLEKGSERLRDNNVPRYKRLIQILENGMN